uniref:Protein kinase domain-containing protein n=1 Tax=Caenorhabditis tropicalis TaxID=1561998 RepID=A0A1I7TC49_9PELO
MLVPARVSINASVVPENKIEADAITLELGKWKLPKPEAKIKGYVSSQAAMVHRVSLTDYEKREIVNHPVVFTVGEMEAKQLECHEERYFTDEDGAYMVSPGDHIGFQYEVVQKVGEGSYADVLECIDKSSEKRVVVKMNKIRKTNQYAEAMMLMQIRELSKGENPYFVNVLNYAHFRNHFFIVLDKMEMDLKHYIYNVKKPSLNEGARMMTSVLEALAFMKFHGIIHGDLKPSNILLNLDHPFDLKVCDFGLSRMVSEANGNEIYQSRFYRAPEVFCRGPLTPAIDMWSFGLIIAEMYLGKPYFDGFSDFDQFALIQQYLGYPPLSYFQKCRKMYKFFTPAGYAIHCRIKQLPFTGERYLEIDPLYALENPGRLPPGSTPFCDDFPKAEQADLCDFLEKCLVWEGKKRITPLFAFNHPLFSVKLF